MTSHDLDYTATWHGKDVTNVRTSLGGEKVEVESGESVKVTEGVAQRLRRERDWEVDGEGESKFDALNTAPKKVKAKTGPKPKKDEKPEEQTVDQYKTELDGKTDEEIDVLLKDNDIISEGTREEKIDALLADFDGK